MAAQAKQVILTSKAPAPKPFLSQAVTLNGLVYTSGAVGIDPATEKVISGTTGDRTEQCLENLSNILEAAGSSIEKARNRTKSHASKLEMKLKVTIFIDDMAKYASMNEGYLKAFNKGAMPVRICVAVKQLPLGTDVEIEIIAHQ
ncbi:YjgF-like protein [Penicillium argentinense]|uniref:YjgF-like protein n=1 Tax=Penicillium argentinense TaxID=1131581 RepID=A0A9W9KBZ0_9EURO|nr:YjgF-like protein [Penicillium argentinense]KAJ5100141.1 YjgF-like protein [Penicillium argentinense]